MVVLTFVAITESWDGTSWTEVADLSTGRRELAGFGVSNLSGLAAGGNAPPVSAATEEWSFPTSRVVQEGQVWVLSVSGSNSVMKGYAAQGTGSWATGGTMNTARANNSQGVGATNSAVQAASGFAPGAPGVTVNVEDYNGSSWTEIANVNTARFSAGMAGTNTASLLYAGAAPPLVAVTELWNGSSWTEVNDLNTARKLGSYFGATNTAAIYATGNSTAVESWNGTSWSEVAEINTNGVKRSGFGTQTSGLIAGGEASPPGAVIDSTEVWNGSAWTEVNNLNTARQGAQSSSGTNSTVGLYFGGSDPGALTGKTELWTVPCRSRF